MEMFDTFIAKLKRLVDGEKFETALQIYEESAFSNLEKITSQNAKRALLLMAANIYYFNQMYDASNDQLRILEEQCENIKSNVDFMILKFQLMISTGKIAEAAKFIKIAVSRFKQKDDYYKLNFYLGKSHFWSGDYSKANNCFQQCYRYYSLSPDHYMLGNILYMLGYTAFQRSFFSVANSFFEKALESFRIAGKNNQIGATYHIMGITAYRVGCYEDAAENLRLATIHFKECGSKLRIIESDIAAARVSIFLEEYDRAEKVILKSYRESKEIQYKRGEALSAEFLGEVYYHRAEYKKSLRYLEIAEKLALEIAPRGDMAVEVYRRLGDLFIALEEAAQAEKYLLKALDIGKHLQDRYELGSIYRAYGMLHAKKENIDRARSFFIESIITFQVIKERYELARTYVMAADMYKRWCRMDDIPDEYRAELLQDSDAYEVEAMHLYQSLGLEKKIRQVEKCRGKCNERIVIRDGSRFIKLKTDRTWLYNERIVARSMKMREILYKVECLAASTIPVFVTGETGTGKEIVARLLHELSDRSSGPFVPVNCASIADPVFESEIFGHKRGAFTGAVSEKIGLMERASGGTLFLDEISELTDRQQAKLLRALEERCIRRVGETKERQVDVRLVSASNDNVSAFIDSGRLRLDFFFRIAVERIDLAPLRERREDIIPLFSYYLKIFGDRDKVEREVPTLLERYHWPGNVRELINIVKALAQLCKSDGIIRTQDLPQRIRDRDSCELKPHGKQFIDKMPSRKLLSANSCRENPDQIRELIVSSLERFNDNRSAAARELGISRATLYRRMQELNLR